MNTEQLDNRAWAPGDRSLAIPTIPTISAMAVGLQAPTRAGGPRRMALAAVDTSEPRQTAAAIAAFDAGTRLLEQRMVEEAIALFDQAIALDPELPEIHFNRANALAALELFAAALQGYDTAIELRCCYSQAHSNRGNTLYALGHYGEAITSFDQAIVLQPDMPEPYLNRGNALVRLNRYAEAFHSYEAAVTRDSKLAEAVFNKGLALQIMMLDARDTPPGKLNH